jgi:hypothetical protein
MIDPLKEALIRPKLAAALYPVGEDGKPVHVCQVYRDMRYGRDGILLESVRTPRLATSREAVARFFHQITAARKWSPPRGGYRSPSARSRANSEVERELDGLGI